MLIPLLSLFSRFNPRPREGGDEMKGVTRYDAENVSIHAPVKGATFAKISVMFPFVRFQSTPP